jgi:hypothetical protein
MPRLRGKYYFDLKHRKKSEVEAYLKFGSISSGSREGNKKLKTKNKKGGEGKISLELEALRKRCSVLKVRQSQ